jgi:hypothetical protein
MPLQSVDALPALPHQHVPSSKHDTVRLLLFILDRNEAHARSLSRLADRFGISRIVLLPLHERIYIGRRYQPDGMAQFCDLSTPIGRPTASLQGNEAVRSRPKELDQLASRQPPAKQDMPGRICPMHLENLLRDIKPDRANL